jgi:hypothetical protein
MSIYSEPEPAGGGGFARALIDEPFRRLLCQIESAEFQEIAVAALSAYQGELGEAARQTVDRMVAEKPKFGYWTVSESEYDREYILALELGRLQVFKGSAAADQEQFDLARRLSRSHPDLVALNRFDYRRQFRVFLSPRALAMRRFALVETARQGAGARSAFPEKEYPDAAR